MLHWDQETLDSEKNAIRDELEAVGADSTETQRLTHCLSRISDLETDDSSIGRMRRYIYAMSALVHHERVGGLSTRQTKNLTELALAILQVEGIRPRLSRLASTYGDIHTINSQIMRKEGATWQAAWEQQLALHLAGEFPSGGLGFQLLAMANRALRLGHTQLAQVQFDEAEKAGIIEKYRPRLWLGVASMLILKREFAAAEAKLQLIFSTCKDSRILSEAEWMRLVAVLMQNQDLLPLLALTRRGKKFYEATYVIEVTMWGLTVSSKTICQKLPKLGTLRRNPTLQPDRLGVWYDAGVVLQECYDSGISLQIRLRKLGLLLERRSHLLTLDKELLLLAAATRWLARCKSTSLARFVLAEYRAKSAMITENKTSDALGVLGDLTERDWAR